MILVDFGRNNESKLTSGWHQKSMPTSKGHFFEKLCFSSGETIILKVLEIEVGNPNRLKIDQKLKPKLDSLLASIFDGF